MDRQIVLYALLFSVPPAIGLMGFFTILFGGGPVNPWGVAVGLAVGTGVFAVVVLAASAGEPETDRRDPG